jgi:hypothetical protein
VSIPVHIVDQIDGSAFLFTDKVIAGLQLAVANAAGGSAGTPVSTSVSFPAGSLPPNYMVHVTPSQAAMVSVTNKTSSGFNVVLTPLATVTLAAGTFDAMVVG